MYYEIAGRKVGKLQSAECEREFYFVVDRERERDNWIEQE